jgi:hypothetical protein
LLKFGAKEMISVCGGGGGGGGGGRSRVMILDELLTG